MTKIRMLNCGALALLMILTTNEVWWAQQSLVAAMLCGVFVPACAWWVGVSFGKALQAECDSDAVYKREQQTVAAGYEVIDAEWPWSD